MEEKGNRIPIFFSKKERQIYEQKERDVGSRWIGCRSCGRSCSRSFQGGLVPAGRNWQHGGHGF